MDTSNDTNSLSLLNVTTANSVTLNHLILQSINSSNFSIDNEDHNENEIISRLGFNGNSSSAYNVQDGFALGLPSEFIKKIHNICILVVMLVVMLSMGCDMNFKQIRNAVRKPVGVLTGMACQFCIMPLAGFTLIKSLGVSGLFGTGVLLVSCCPGGSISNILTFLADGDITLSVTMTTLSTAIALGMMPLNMWIYGHGMDTGDIVIPYASIAMSLVYITSPVAIGMVIHWRFPHLAPKLVKAGSIFGFVMITSLCIFDIVLYYRLYQTAPWALFLSTVLMLPFGYSLGYFVACILQQSPKIRRTVGIESGVQNASLAMTIAYMSFEMPAQAEVRMFPVIYGIAQALIGFSASGAYRVYLSCCNKEAAKQEQNKTANGVFPLADVTVTEKLLTGEDIVKNKVEIRPISYCDGV